MDKLYQKSINKRIQKLSEDIGEIKVRSEIEPIWSTPKPIDEKEEWGTRLNKKMGVYQLIYKPNNTIMSIGKGMIGDRKSRHKRVFLNKGKPIENDSSTSDSPAGRKMYRHDTNINNWLFSWCEVGNSELALEYEIQLQFHYEPEFNDLSMAGK
jgi:hypothetical protein